MPLIGRDRSEHMRCKLAAALRLVAGKHVRVPARAYVGWAPSRFSRLLQLGNGFFGFLSTATRRTLITGNELAYISGELECLPRHTLRNSLLLLKQKKPFFVVSGHDPGASISSITGCAAAPLPVLILSSHCTVVIAAHWRGTPSILHYGECCEAKDEIARGADGLRIAQLDPDVRDVAPRPLAQMVLGNGASLSVESRVIGAPCEFSWSRLDTAMELCLSRKVSSQEPARLEQRVIGCYDDLPNVRDQIAPLGDALLEWHGRTRIPGQLTHGDYWLGNVLFEKESVSGVIDWEWARNDGLLLTDALHMLVMSCATVRNVNVANFLRQLWLDEFSDSALKERVSHLGARSGLTKDDMKFVALALWFEYIYQNIVRGRMPSITWSEDMIPRTIPVITKWLR